MVSTDPISDMLTRIRNAIAVNRSEVTLPYSSVKERVARILAENNFLDDVKVVEGDKTKQLSIVINQTANNARITEVVRLSKPGRRLYASADKIPTVKRGRGIVVISTSQGVMSGDDARSKRLGGELICKVY